ncbi:glycosyltransferase family 2 protein [Tamaricihabitans halophyticus]|uniref:glycosyltransferase family 2 protein n=1 Tax=Tamaricihabitans halophyticus TaxID=1262583 RepID=UPI001FB2ACE4|nr:glycosyltransferase family 2 protein [Tamaricihabitans halophyticus]
MSEPTPDEQASNGPNYGDELAVVIVTYHSGETLGACLDSLGPASNRPVRVVLSDNTPDDPSAAEAASRTGAKLVTNRENVGYGAGINRGVAELGPEVGWIVIANADLEFAAGSLDELREAAERWPRGGAFGPLISEPDGSTYPSARLLPSLGRGAGHAVFGKVWPANPWTRAYRQSDNAVIERRSEWLSGSCQLLRRSAFDSVQGFDSRYFMYFEDVDLGDRLGKAGWQNIYVPTATVMHVGGMSTAKAPRRMLAEHHRSAYRYLADRHTGWKWAPVRFSVKAGLAARLKLSHRA